MSILELFCSVDDFWRQVAPTWQHDLLTSGQRQRLRPTQMYPSEMMTIVILFHQSHYRTFKAYYTQYVQRHLQSEFPTLVSYQHFVELMPTLLVPLVAYLHTQLGRCSGISFIDSTPLAVCHNARIHSHRVFAGRAARGKTSVGWFFGFKLHLVVNDQGELLAFCLTAGNVDDRHPVPKLAKGLIGKLFGDKGYLSQPLAQHLLSPTDCSSSPSCVKRCITACSTGQTNSCYANAPSSKPLLISSKTFPRSSIRAIAVLSTSWSTWSQGLSPIAISPKSLRSGCNSPRYQRRNLSRTHVILDYRKHFLIQFYHENDEICSIGKKYC